MAVSLGVRSEDILLDPTGVNTQKTVRGTVPLLVALGCRRVLAVSHFYHLPRVKLAHRHAGLEVYTVPAQESRGLLQMPWLVAREVVALWTYDLRALLPA